MPDTDVASQNEAIAFLDREARSGAAKRIDTHASILFLEPERVLKIKRAVWLPFLDYSTLEKRKHACEEELAVNRPHAPKLYRRVVPITRGEHGPEIGGNGPAIEWAVEMARFDEEKTFDRLAKNGAITPELAEAVADVVREIPRARGALRRIGLACLHRADHRSQQPEISCPAVACARRGRAASRGKSPAADREPRAARTAGGGQGLCAAAMATRISATSC